MKWWILDDERKSCRDGEFMSCESITTKQSKSTTYLSKHYGQVTSIFQKSLEKNSVSALSLQRYHLSQSTVVTSDVSIDKWISNSLVQLGVQKLP